MTSDQASLMPTSLDALTTLDLALIAAIAILSLVSGGLALRSQVSPQASPSDNRQNHSNTLKALQEQLKTAQAESKPELKYVITLLPNCTLRKQQRNGAGIIRSHSC